MKWNLIFCNMRLEMVEMFLREIKENKEIKYYVIVVLYGKWRSKQKEILGLRGKIEFTRRGWNFIANVKGGESTDYSEEILIMVVIMV